MAQWSDLEDELALWHAEGQKPTFWWRDDDAVSVTPALSPLLSLSERHDVPVHLAVIPARLEAELIVHLRDHSQAYVMQHGFAHLNHEPKGLGASEFGESRDLALQMQDLRAGWQLLNDAQIPCLVPGFVPPWNRMSRLTLAALPALGYKFVSAYSGHTPVGDVPGLRRVDGHVDPVRWKHGQQFRGATATLGLILQHLKDRRLGRADRDMPTCFLTHHLVTEAEIWAFADQLFVRTSGIADWISVASLLDGD